MACRASHEGQEQVSRSRVVGRDGVWPLLCATCGRELKGDRDDDPKGDDGPTCGECAREREFVMIDQADGELDGHLN